MACEQVEVVDMQGQAQVVLLMELLFLAITLTAHPPRWVLEEQQPPLMLASNVDKQVIGLVIAQVSTLAHVVLLCMFISCCSTHMQALLYGLLYSLQAVGMIEVYATCSSNWVSAVVCTRL